MSFVFPKYRVAYIAFWLIFHAMDGQAISWQAENDNGVFAFRNVNVVPMDSERILYGQTVLVRNGLISNVGPSLSLKTPPGARSVDARGQYLLPGLTDFHIHLRSTDELLSYLSYGVTSVVHLSGPQQGAPHLLRYRKQLDNGEIVGPNLYVSGPMLDGAPPIWPSVSIVVNTPEEARWEVTKLKRTGYDLVKVYNNLSPGVLKAITETAHKLEMAVVGHIPRGAGREQALQNAITAGIDMIAHGEEFFFTYFYGETDSLLEKGILPQPNESHIPYVARMVKEADIAVTPNLSFVAMTRRQLDELERIFGDPETRFLHPGVLRLWLYQNPTTRQDLERFDMRERVKYPFLQKLTKHFANTGIALLLGTDASAPGLFPGKSAHLELAELVNAGLSPFQALASGTRNPGKFMGRFATTAEPFGTIEIGKRADLVLLDFNPLSNIKQMSRIKGVMVKGRWLSITELRRKRERIARSYRH